MASKLYTIAFQLGAKIQSNFGKAFNAAEKQLNNLNNESTKTNKGFLGLGEGLGSVVKTAAGLAAGYLSLSAVKNYSNECISAAKEQITQETKLQAILKNVHSLQKIGPNAYKEANKQLIEMSEKLQKFGVINKSTVIAGYQQLATFQLGNKEISTLSNGMADLIAQRKGLNATSADAVGIANLMGKAMEGNTGALSRVGITFTKAQAAALKSGNSMQRAAILSKILQQNVGGVNAALRQTDDGKIWAAKNAYEEMRVEIGRKLLPIQAKFAGIYAKAAPTITKLLSTVTDKLSFGIDYVQKIFTKTGPMIEKNFKNVVSNISSGINYVFPIFKQWIQLIIKIGSELFSGIGGGANKANNNVKGLAKGGLNLITNTLKLLSNNVGIVKAGVIGLTAAWAVQKGILLALNVVNMIHNAQSLIAGIRDKAETGYIIALYAAEAIHTGLLKAQAAAQFVLNAAMNANPIGLVILLITGLIAAGISLYKNWDTVKAKAFQLWTGIQAAFGPVGKFISGVFNEAWKGIKTFLNFAISGINTLISGLDHLNVKVPSWVPGIGGKQFGIKIPKIPMLASGAYIKHRAGGILANIGEGREDEVVSPVSKLQKIINNTNNDDRPIKVTYQIIIEGNADKDSIYKGIKKGNDDLEKRLDKIKANRNRLSLNPQ